MNTSMASKGLSISRSRRDTSMRIVFPLILSLATACLATPTDSIRICGINAGMSKAFAIESRGKLFLIDAGSPGQEKTILKQLARFSSQPLEMIVVTHAHFDHYGSAQALRSLTGAKIAIGRDDYDDMCRGQTKIDHTHGLGSIGKLLLPLVEALLKPTPTKADIILNDGDSLAQFGLQAVVLRTPGHTRGSITIVLNQTIAFVSDLIVTQPKLSSQCFYADDWAMIAASLKRVQATHPSQVYAGHSIKPIAQAAFMQLHPVVQERP
jgi:hydroxyacylglutathione hydrolase